MQRDSMGKANLQIEAVAEEYPNRFEDIPVFFNDVEE